MTKYQSFITILHTFESIHIHEHERMSLGHVNAYLTCIKCSAVIFPSLSSEGAIQSGCHRVCLQTEFNGIPTKSLWSNCLTMCEIKHDTKILNTIFKLNSFIIQIDKFTDINRYIQSMIKGLILHNYLDSVFLSIFLSIHLSYTK